MISGTSTQWIRFVAEPGETVNLVGGSNGVQNGVVIKPYWTTPSFNEVAGFHISNISRNCIWDEDVPDIRLIGLEITGCGTGAVELQHAQRITLEGGSIHDNNTNGWTSAVDLLWCRGGNVIRGNRIWSNSDSPIGQPDSEGHGIIMDNCDAVSGALIENNVIWNNEGMCINIYQSDGATIRNNTCYMNGIRPGGGEISTLGNRTTVHNNILVPRGGTFALNLRYVNAGYNVDPGTMSEDADLIVAQSGDRVIWWGNSVGTVAQFRAQNPGGWGATTVIGDPLFVNAAGADFHITAGSPARDTGDNLHGASVDIEGRTRPYGVVVDRGAYEFVP
jgi:parallel beta-helix repeat protein